MAQSTNAEAAFGTELNLCVDASGTSPGLIAGIRDLNWTVSAQIEDTSAHDIAQPWRTKIVTLRNMGPVEIMVNWAPLDPSHNPTAGLMYVFKEGLERTYTIEETDDSDTTIEFNALVANIKGSRGVAAVRTGSITFEGTGVPDFDA